MLLKCPLAHICYQNLKPVPGISTEAGYSGQPSAFSHYEDCTGQNNCTVPVAWNYTLLCCDQDVYLARTNFMRMHYQCIAESSIVELSSVLGFGPQREVHIRNLNYPQRIPNCSISTGYHAMIQSSSGTIVIKALDLRLSFNSTGLCSQQLHIVDGNLEKDITCYNNNNFKETTLYNSTTNSITVRMDNTLSNVIGNFWIKVTANDANATLSMNIVKAHVMYDCGDDLEVEVPIDSRTKLAECSSGVILYTNISQQENPEIPTSNEHQDGTTRDQQELTTIAPENQPSYTTGKMMSNTFEENNVEEYTEEACYGSNADDYLQPSCSNGHVIYVSDVYAYAKKKSTGCLEVSYPVYFHNETYCCRYVNETEDFTLIEDIATQFRSYHTSNDSLYIWNTGYPAPMEKCNVSTGYYCDVESNNGSIVIAAVDLRLAFNSTGQCAQQLHVTDGDQVKYITCYDDNNFKETILYQSSHSRILIRLDNTLPYSGGHFWIKVSGNNINATLTMLCGGSVRKYTCGSELGVTMPVSNITAVASCSSGEFILSNHTFTTLTSSGIYGSTLASSAGNTISNVYSSTTDSVKMSTANTNVSRYHYLQTTARVSIVVTNYTSGVEKYVDEACYGSHQDDYVEPSCPDGYVIYVSDVYTYAKKKSTGCPKESSYFFHNETYCCRYINDTEDCGLRYSGYPSDFSHYIDCAGVQYCKVPVAWNDTLLCCDQSTYLARTNYMRMYYQCIQESRIADIGSPKIYADEREFYLWNNGYSNKIQNCSLTSGDTCFIKSSSGSIIVAAMDLKLALNSTGHCVQKLHVTDGNKEMDITCYDNNNFKETVLYHSTNSNITIRLDNVLMDSDGRFWIKVTANGINSTLSMACGGSNPVYRCGNEINIEAPNESTSLVAQCSSGKPADPTDPEATNHTAIVCYNENQDMSVYHLMCSDGKLIRIVELYAMAKLKNVGCDNTTQSSPNNCCNYSVDDCSIRYTGDYSQYRECNGKNICNISLLNIEINGSCGQTYLEKANYIYILYQCIPGSILQSGTFTNKSSAYISNLEFSGPITACNTGMMCTIKSTYGTITITALDVRFALNQKGKCAQRLHITDGAYEAEISCFHNNNFDDEIVYISQTDVLQIRLDNILNSTAGFVWISLKPNNDDARLIGSCSAQQPVYTCGDEELPSIEDTREYRLNNLD
ncbi:hypothetical protein CHS0354_012979 [Potamilus streckersoni]|uniref:Uncharacterized protein n=1 Tax=Potamilus streckersoni TaxID=2493646 RepID=A0AAE0W8N1_9BIVA|nr:hypothetical protein CHS0354_012979 [Potamilus streckersoni]